MIHYSVKIIDSLDSLKENALSWNSLWQRSDVSLPTLRAEMIDLWISWFASDKPFRALVVEAENDEDRRFVAAIPLYIERKLKFLRTGMLPSNDWSYCGDLLLDPDCATETVLSLLLDHLKRLPIDLLWLDPIRFEQARWKAFRNVLEKTQRKSQLLLRYRTAVASVDGDREALLASWKKSEIGNIRRRFKKYYLSDSYRFEAITGSERIVRLLPDCFKLENAGWKGRDGGSIIGNRMESFYLEQAGRLSENGLFRLYLLYYENDLIAFRYCLVAKGTLCSLKTSYDPSRRDLAPGQIILWLIINQLIDDPEIDRLDFMGIAAPHQNVWNPELQAVGQCVLPISCTGKAFFFFYDRIMPLIRRYRERREKNRMNRSENRSPEIEI